MSIIADISQFANRIKNYDDVKSQLEGKLKPFVKNHGKFTAHGKAYEYHTVLYKDSLTFDYTNNPNDDSEYPEDTIGVFLGDLPHDVLLGIYHGALENSKGYKREDIERERLDTINEAFEQNKYIINGGCIWLVKTTRPIDRKGRPLKDDNGNFIEPYEMPIKLSNFSAQIIKEIIRDDGAEQQKNFIITGTVGDEELSPIDIPADKFAGMSWINQGWGATAIVNAGPLYKEHLRAAIQYLSPKTERHIIYSHIGWRKIGDRWCYLHVGGAVNSLGNTTSIEVEPGDSRLRFYKLPEPPYGKELIKKIHEVLALIDGNLAPDHVIYPIIGAIFRAPLCEAYEADFTNYLTGQTGTRKTSLIAVFQAFYGAAFSEINLPGNWNSTANALERLAYLVKDSVFTVDDFTPRGASIEVQRLHDKSDRLLRGQANKAGRQRMRPDRSMAPEYYPRGVIIASGEDVPTGHSLRGRMLITELHPGDVDLEQLSMAQQKAREGVYAEVMSAYIKYLTLKMNEYKRTLESRQNEIRDKIRNELVEGGAVGVHPKTPTTLASLYIGFSTFLDFIQEECLGTFSADYCNKLRDEYLSNLFDIAFKQIDYLETEDPAKRFIKLVETALTAGYGHVADAKDNQPPSFVDNMGVWGWRCHKNSRITNTGEEVETETWHPMGRCMGWLSDNGDGDELYLDPGATYTIIQTVARDQGTGQLLTQKTLWKRLKERGTLRHSDDGRATIRAIVDGNQKRVLCLSSSTINQLVMGGGG